MEEKVIVIDIKDCDTEVKKELVYRIAYLSEYITKIEKHDDAIEIVVPKEEAKELEEAIGQMKEELIGRRNVTIEPLHEHVRTNICTEKDVYEQMVEAGWIVPYEKGLVGYGAGFSKILKLFDQIVLQWAAEYDAVEYSYPDLINLETLNQYNYLKEFPQHIMFSAHLRHNKKILEDFSNSVGQEKILSEKYISRPAHANKLAVCPHVYKQYENKVVDTDNMIAVSTLGKCKRYEAANMTKMERLLDFTMREIVFIGDGNEIIQIREEIMKKAIQLMDFLDVSYNIKPASDPFFMSEANPKMLLQKKFNLKYELNMVLPYNNSEMSAMSFNIHKDHFTECFHIKGKDGKKVNTGCIGIGCERMVYALLCQYGMGHYDELVEKLSSKLK